MPHNAALIREAFYKLADDAFDPSLRTHKLSGRLALYLACSWGYDFRIIFTIEKDIERSKYEHILLLDIGTHEDVYNLNSHLFSLLPKITPDYHY